MAIHMFDRSRTPGRFRSAPSYSPGATVADAQAEARWQGDRKVGTEHILLALLHDPASEAALGVDLETARAAAAALDRAALRAVGLGDLPDAPPISRPERGWLPLAPSVKAVLVEALEGSGHARRGPQHVLLALLCLERPDPAALLLDELGVDRAAVRGRLAVV